MKKLLLLLILPLILTGCTLTEKEQKLDLYIDYMHLEVTDGSSIPFQFKNIKEKNIIITASNPDIVNIDEKEYFIRALEVGYTKIYIDVNKSNLSVEFDLYIEAKTVEKPKLIASNPDIDLQNPAMIYFENIETLGSPMEIYELDYNKDLASIDENLLITPLSEGELVVTLTHRFKEEFTSSVTINISDNHENRLVVTTKNNNFTVAPGEYLDLLIDNSSLNLEENYRFYPYSPYIGTVTSDGKIVSIKEGIIYIGVHDRNSNKRGSLYIQSIGNDNEVDYLERFLSIAMNEIGYREKTNGYTKFGDWFNLQYELLDWCAMYVVWSANQAGIPTTIIPRQALVLNVMTYYIEINRFYYKENYEPKRGDLIIFMSSGASHIGIVTSYNKTTKTVYTVEGNTSNRVAERSYAWNYRTITGYGSPDYSKLNF